MHIQILALLICLLTVSQAAYGIDDCSPNLHKLPENASRTKFTRVSDLAVETADFEKKSVLASKLDPKYQQWRNEQIETSGPGVSYEASDEIAGMNLWSKVIQEASGSNDWLRGMFLDSDGMALRAIAKNGFEASESNDDKTYFARDPGIALSYAKDSEIVHPSGPQLRVIFQISGKGSRIKKEAGWTQEYGATHRGVPLSAIKKIYIFDMNGPDAFPFLEFSPEELARSLRQR